MVMVETTISILFVVNPASSFFLSIFFYFYYYYSYMMRERDLLRERETWV